MIVLVRSHWHSCLARLDALRSRPFINRDVVDIEERK